MTDDNNIGIENELKANKDKLESIRAKVEEQNKQQQEISKYVAELEKFNAEVKQAAGSYEKIVTEEIELQKFANKRTLDQEVKESLPQIEEVKSRLDQIAGYPGKQSKELETKQSSFQVALDSAKTATEQAQRKYEELKGKQKVIDATLKSMRDLKAIVEREQPENKLAAFYILERFRELLQDLTLKEPAEFTQDLEKAGQALADASREVRSKSVALDKVTADLEDAKKRDTKYRADVFAELQKLKPKPQVKSAQQAKQPPQSRPSAQSAASVAS